MVWLVCCGTPLEELWIGCERQKNIWNKKLKNKKRLEMNSWKNVICCENNTWRTEPVEWRASADVLVNFNANVKWMSPTLIWLRLDGTWFAFAFAGIALDYDCSLIPLRSSNSMSFAGDEGVGACIGFTSSLTVSNCNIRLSHSIHATLWHFPYPMLIPWHEQAREKYKILTNK